ncbi:RNA 2',3'-cyclic phosphodiesterase [Salinifilum ghardaiensis]
MRLFTALWPAEVAVDHLAAEIAELPERQVAELSRGLRRFRFVPADRWHLTLCFHGEAADPDEIAERLDREAADLVKAEVVPPRLRLAGAGVFRSVLWIGVEPATNADAAVLGELVRIAGGDPEGYRGHLTVARWSNGKPTRALAEFFAEYAGPRWDVPEITLVRSVPGESGPEYRVLHRVPAGAASPSG